MWLPEQLPKAHIAFWLAEALATIVLRSGDSVTFVSLFQKSRARVMPPIKLRGSNAVGSIRTALLRLFQQAPTDYDDFNLAASALEMALPPTAIWLTVSDFYFAMEPYGKALARHMTAARDGYRWLIPLDLDAWPYERELIGKGARRIEGPRAAAAERTLELQEAQFQQVEQRIETHKRSFFEEARCSAFDASRWHWPGQANANEAAFFRHQFDDDAVLQRIFMRQAS
jgi:hypothetical protein